MKKIDPRERLGEKSFNYQGCEMEIIEWNNAHNISIKFLGDFGGSIKRNVYYYDFKRGKVKNLYYPEVYTVGYEGDGKYSFKTHPKIKSKWYGIFNRCYNIGHKNRNPSYNKTTICKKWYNFQNFAKWFEENYNAAYMENWELDKDLLSNSNNKSYSAKTCCFVPNDINSSITKRKNTNSILPRGIEKRNNKFIVRGKENETNKRYTIGTYITENEAIESYKVYKKQKIIYLAQKYKELLPSYVYKALVNFDVNLIL